MNDRTIHEISALMKSPDLFRVIQIPEPFLTARRDYVLACGNLSVISGIPRRQVPAKPWLELTAPGYFFDGPLACEALPV